MIDNMSLDVLPWPSQSPDLNHIEHLWTCLKRKLNAYHNKPMGVHELWGRVQKEWKEIPVSFCEDLVSSVPRRCAAVL